MLKFPFSHSKEEQIEKLFSSQVKSNKQQEKCLSKMNKYREINIDDYSEKILNSEDYPIDICRKYMQNDLIGIIGYGPQGRNQARNLVDNKYNVIVGVRKDGDSWELAKKDGWIPNENLYDIETVSKKANVIKYLLSDAGQIEMWNSIKNNIQKGDTLYFSHGFGLVYKHLTGIEPRTDVDIILLAPKGPGGNLRKQFLEKRGIACSYAIYQDYTGNALNKIKALGFGIGAKNMFETTFEKEVYSDLTGERCVLMGMIQGAFKAQFDVLVENGHSPTEAWYETVEEALESLYPLINEKGMDWMFENCSTTAQRGALDWSDKFYNVIKPEIKNCYSRVVSGEEAETVIEANKDPNYRINLEKELNVIKGQTIWKSGNQLRLLR